MRYSLITFLSSFWAMSFLLPGPGTFAAESQKERWETILLQGVEKALNLDEKGAVAQFGKAVELDPQNPVGFSCLAMTYLFFYETSFTEKEKKGNEGSLLQAVADAQTRARKRIEQDPRDGEACFAMALAKMVMDRWEMARKNYYRAFREAQSVWEYLEKTRELNPDNYDVYYPMGVIHYYLAQLSGVVQWIASLFITSGDREGGLKELELAAEKGFLLKDMARSNLVSIYYGYENQPARALPLARMLKEKYPDNYNFSFALADTLSSLGRFDEALSVAGEIEKGIRAGIPPYRSELWPRYHQLLGKIYLDRGDYERSAQYLKLALKDVAPYNARVRAWALVRLGMIQDARKERNLAENYYRRALEVEGVEGRAQRAAREYLETPYEPPVRK
jgi:tetratricopeptide (TPR) repeat protein